jgi:hypothetical protein
VIDVFAPLVYDIPPSFATIIAAVKPPPPERRRINARPQKPQKPQTHSPTPTEPPQEGRVGREDDGTIPWGGSDSDATKDVMLDCGCLGTTQTLVLIWGVGSLPAWSLDRSVSAHTEITSFLNKWYLVYTLHSYVCIETSTVARSRGDSEDLEQGAID